MSDVMLLGVLRMPPEIWQDNELDVRQRHSRYLQAADRIEADAEEITRLRGELAACIETRDLAFRIRNETIETVKQVAAERDELKGKLQAETIFHNGTKGLLERIEAELATTTASTRGGT